MFFDEITPSIVHESTSRPDSGESPTSEHNDLDLDAAAGLYCAVEEVFFFSLFAQRTNVLFSLITTGNPRDNVEKKKKL